MGWKDSVWEDLGNPRKSQEKEALDDSFTEAHRAVFEAAGEVLGKARRGYSMACWSGKDTVKQQGLPTDHVRQVSLEGAQQGVQSLLFARLEAGWHVLAVDLLCRPILGWVVTDGK